MNKITIYQHEREPKIMFYIYEGRLGRKIDLRNLEIKNENN